MNKVIMKTASSGLTLQNKDIIRERWNAILKEAIDKEAEVLEIDLASFDESIDGIFMYGYLGIMADELKAAKKRLILKNASERLIGYVKCFQQFLYPCLHIEFAKN